MAQLTHFDIISKLCANGFEAYLVGGAVRDVLRGIDPSDFDVVTKATPDEIGAIFSNAKVNLVGKSFGVVLVDGIEVATYRFDTYPESNGAENCVVTYAETLEDDLSRRDLTINSMALCPTSGDVIDIFGGLVDLQHRIVRFVGNPYDRINEDPNRIVRACRFLAKIQGTFEENTLSALQCSAHLVGSHVKKERLAAEIRKAVQLLENPSLFFSALELTGVLSYIFPGIERCVHHPHGAWHKETVWEHLMLAGDAVSARFPLVRLAAFLHDVGKPTAFERENDGTFKHHEAISGDIVDQWLLDLRFSDFERETVVNLIRSHMWAGNYDELTPKAVRKFRFRLHEYKINPDDWLRLRIADRSANLCKDKFSLSAIKNRAVMVGIGKSVEDVSPVFSVNNLALKGGELIELFNLPRGPVVGQLQKHLLNFVVENGFELNTKDALVVECVNYLKGERDE